MKKHGIAALLLAIFAMPAMAGRCPTIMVDIDRLLQDQDVVASLSESELERARELRAKGEELHNTGKHGESVATLDQAMAILDSGGSSSGSGGYSY